MPRKKKKSPHKRRDGDADHSSPSLTTRKVQPPKPVDVISVRLGKPGSRKRPNSRMPHVLMSDQDASRLNLSPEDEILLLSSGKPTGAAIARAQLLGGRQTATTPLSDSRSGNVPPGTIQVTPSSLVDMIFGAYQDSPSIIPETPPGSVAPATPRPTPQNSSSDKKKSSFSFQTPSPPSQPCPSPSQPDKLHTTQQQIWAVKLSSRLGRRITARLCTIAKHLVVRSAVGSNIQQQNAVFILQRLVLAHCEGRYLQRGEGIQISFQGKPLDLTVESLEAAPDHSNRDAVATELSTLRLDDDDEDLSQLDEKDVWNAAASSCDLLLYKVNYSTVVQLADTENKASEKVTTKLQAVTGLDRTMDEVRSLLSTPLKQPELFTRAGLQPPKGVLLYGPSGVGKTCLAKQLGAEFQQESFSVEFVNCSSLLSKTAVVGEAERTLSMYFRVQASNDRGRLLIFDDVHLICPRRGGPTSAGTDRLAGSLLAQLDGISDTNSSLFVVLAITNSPSQLDPALRRPGRLDAEIEVPPPDEAGTRVEVIKSQLEYLGVRAPVLDNESWLALGKLAKGFNGADCMLAVKEALRSALLRGSSSNANAKVSLEFADLRVEDLRSAIRATKPSAIKSITVEITQVKWSSIGGMDSVKRELREAIELPVSHQASSERLGIPPPRGILLYGPPGCSKTLMARALATEGQMNFLAVKGPELLSKWLGESERALASLFRRARMASPSIIFFDEIDAIATKRGIGDSPSSGRLLSQLLTELDGINHCGSAAGRKPHRVVVVGATNRPDLLDSALTRPGRIDRMIYVGVPDCGSRERIFELSLRGKSCSNDIDIPHLASDAVSRGYSGAEVVAICRDAALLALEECDDPMAEDTPSITMRHLLQALEGMQRQITPRMLDFYRSYRENILNT